jgi:hypothetical protein
LRAQIEVATTEANRVMRKEVVIQGAATNGPGPNVAV